MSALHLDQIILELDAAGPDQATRSRARDPATHIDPEVRRVVADAFLAIDRHQPVGLARIALAHLVAAQLELGDLLSHRVGVIDREFLLQKLLFESDVAELVHRVRGQPFLDEFRQRHRYQRIPVIAFDVGHAWRIADHPLGQLHCVVGGARVFGRVAASADELFHRRIIGGVMVAAQWAAVVDRRLRSGDVGPSVQVLFILPHHAGPAAIGETLRPDQRMRFGTVWAAHHQLMHDALVKHHVPVGVALVTLRDVVNLLSRAERIGAAFGLIEQPRVPLPNLVVDLHLDRKRLQVRLIMAAALDQHIAARQRDNVVRQRLAIGRHDVFDAGSGAKQRPEPRAPRFIADRFGLKVPHDRCRVFDDSIQRVNLADQRAAGLQSFERVHLLHVVIHQRLEWWDQPGRGPQIERSAFRIRIGQDDLLPRPFGNR